MTYKTSFSCDRCRANISIKELFRLQKNSITTCKLCNATLHSNETISFNWAFFIGFCSTVIPAEISFKMTNSLATMIIAAVIGGILAVIGIALYAYNTTKFSS
jgi:hypothetical protein